MAIPSRSARGDAGFTLVELLVVILIIGILAAIAIPTFLNQKSKANDASAKELARTAQTVADTIATDHGGDYTSVSTTSLNSVEPTINVTNAGQAELTAASGSASGFTVVVSAPVTGDSFTIVAASGVATRTCSRGSGGNGGGCPTGSW